MCIVHKPQIPSNASQDQKPLPILHNTMLDGMLGNIAAQRNGRNSLRIPLNPLGIPVGGGSVGGGIGSGTSSGSGGSSGGSTSGSTSSGTSTISGSGTGSYSTGGRTRTSIA